MNLVDSVLWNRSTPSGLVDVGAPGTNRFFLVGLHIEAVSAGAYTHAANDVAVGGVVLTPYAVTPGGGWNTQLELYLALEADLGALTGQHAVTIGGDVQAQKYSAIALSDMPQTAPIPFFDVDATVTQGRTHNTAVPANGGLLQMVWNTPNTSAVTFHASMTGIYNENQGNPNSRMAAAYVAPVADIPAQDWPTTVTSALENNLMTVNFVFGSAGPPVVVGEGTYTSEVPVGDTLQTVTTAGVGAAPGIVDGSTVWVVGASNTITAGGIIATTLGGAQVVTYYTLESGAWVERTVTVNGSGAVGTITFPTEPVHLSTAAFTVNGDYTSESLLRLRFRQGADVIRIFEPQGDMSLTSTGGTVDFRLFEPFGPDTAQQAGIMAGAITEVDLMSGSNVLASGFVTPQAPAEGIVFTPATLSPDALDGLVAGQPVMIEDLKGGTLSADGVYTPNTANLVELTYYTSGVERFTAEFGGFEPIAAEISENLTAVNGAFDWPSRGFINVDNVNWFGDSICVRPQSLRQFSRIVHASSRLTEDYAEVMVMNGTPDDNDTFGPAFYTSTAATSGYHLEITSNGGGEPDRIEFRQQDNGVFLNIDFVVLDTPLGDNSIVTLGRFKSSGTWVIKVNGVEVKTISNNKYICDNWGLIAEQRNNGTGCVKAIAANGQSSLQIASINGQVGIVQLTDGPVTVEWTEDHAPTSFDVVDGAGLTHTFASTALGPRQSQFTFDGADVWHGPLIVRANTLEQRGANFPALPGEQYENLGSVISSAGQLMGLQPGDQVTLGLTTNIGQPIKLLANGDVEINGGELTQFATLKRHDGTTRSAAETHYFFDAIAQTSLPNLNYPPGGFVSINLLDHFNSPLDVPTNQLGSSGSTYQVAVNGLPAGLTFAALAITGTLAAAAGSYNITVSITDQAGGAPLVTVWPLVVSAANQGVQPVGAIPQQSGMARKTGGYQFLGAFSDPDNDPFVVSIDSPPAWVTLDADQQTLTWNPSDADTGTFDLVLRAASTSGDLTPATQTLRLVILPFVNNPPIIGAIPNVGLQAGVTLNRTLFIPASDPDGDAISIDVLNPDGSPLSDGLSFNTGSNAFNGKHDIGTVPVIARATDSQGAVADRPFSLLFSLGSPVLTSTPVPPQVWEIGQPIPPLDLTDYIEGLADSYTLSPLVSGVNPVNDQLQGTPDAGLSAGQLVLTITGTNSQGSAVTASFTVTLEDAFVYRRTQRHLAVKGL